MNAGDHLSDTDVLTAVRDSLSRTSLTGPPDVAAILARGRARRRRRIIPTATGTLAVAAGATLAVTALTPGSHDPAHRAAHAATRQPTVQLAAWTVTRLANGNITVSVRDLGDPAGLQQTLRSDGVPASVTFASEVNPACSPYPGGTPRHGIPRLLKHVFPEPYRHLAMQHQPRTARPVHGRPPVQRPSPTSSIVVIDPAALPGNAGVQLGVSPGGGALLLPQVVYASRRCTGS